jgi:folate-binding protein YgfZ
VNAPTLKDHLSRARAAVLAIETNELGVMVVTGGDRQTWLNGMVTCELAKLEPGGAAYGLAVTQKGRVLADLSVIMDRERLLLVVPRTEIDALKLSFDKYLIMEDAEVVAMPEAFAVWQLHGPKSAELLACLRPLGAFGGALDYTGLGGAVVVVGHENEASVREAMATAVAELGGAIGEEASWESLRLTCGIPRFGRDFDLTTYPQEALLEKRAVSFNKGCYLGQEVVCMLELRGHVKRKLVPLTLSAGSPPAKGASVTDAAGAVLGHVTSAAETPDGAPLAFAMIKGTHAVGAELNVGGTSARVTAPPS